MRPQHMIQGASRAFRRRVGARRSLFGTPSTPTCARFLVLLLRAGPAREPTKENLRGERKRKRGDSAAVPPLFLTLLPLTVTRAADHGGRVQPELLSRWSRPRARLRRKVRTDPSEPPPLHLTHPLALSETALLANVNDEPLRARLRVFASFEPGLTSTLSCLTLCADRQSTGAST